MTSPAYSHHFSLKNLPYGVASSPAHGKQCATRLQNTVIFLGALQEGGFFEDVDGLPEGLFKNETLNDFAVLPKPVHVTVRICLQNGLRDGLNIVPENARANISAVTLHLPMSIPAFTDFSNSLHHVQNAGRAILNDPSPPPGFFHFPIGYTGRASTVVVSGTPITRPNGHFVDRSNPVPKTVIYGPSRALDYEMELGVIVGRARGWGEGKGVSAKKAEDYVFGWVLVNDWSARDIQGLEMVPLGPLNGKSFGTSISPWIITTEALEPFKAAAPEPQANLAPHMQDEEKGNYDIIMKVEILHNTTETEPSHTEEGKTVSPIATSAARELFWSHRQMIAHLTSCGSDLRTGDLLGTGTVSGSVDGSYGCLLESTKGGKEKVRLSDGNERVYLLDGDIVRMSAVLGDEESGVGFGECIGEVKAAVV
ncbi:fumarylacetoacetate hydrolase family protein [Aspergillus stella-maris]|uniref:fumarylacetoacetate hydrolase family protein n=1 Tax=Aspergillus stella-maris TaxID=1810926 RepID=UPI003CCD0B96